MYAQGDGKMKRMARQNFAEGQTIQSLPDEIKNGDKEFLKAFQVFLKHMEGMKANYGIVLDITDSSAGHGKARSFIENTGNIFVRFPTEDDPNYKFTVIDPDVFDTEPGEHKFFPSEHLRKRGPLGVFQAVKLGISNYGRDSLLIKQQDERVRMWLDKNIEEE